MHRIDLLALDDNFAWKRIFKWIFKSATSTVGAWYLGLCGAKSASFWVNGLARAVLIGDGVIEFAFLAQAALNTNYLCVVTRLMRRAIIDTQTSL